MNIKGYDIEFLEDDHIYLVDGVILPSITQILKVKFGGKYEGVNQSVLKRASELGTLVHKEIEDFEKYGIEGDTKELRNYKFLKNLHGFNCLGNELPLILFRNDKPVACGTTDLLLSEGDKIGLGDIKRTSALDKEYLSYQLNLYRLAYIQSYEKPIEFLRGLHLREDIRKYIEIPINEEIAWELLEQYERSNNG